ncbi:PD40 domain-containing protein [Desulfotruncus arcticus]|nr:PD40 domain-containing protein [Desulfotruncus arcticus]
MFMVLMLLLIQTGCGSNSKNNGATPTPPTQPKSSEAGLPQADPGAFKGQGLLAFVWDNLLYVLDGDSGDLTKLSDAGRAGEPMWSPDGQWLAYIGYSDAQMDDGKLFIVKPDGSRSYEVNGLPLPVNSNEISWLPASDVLVVAFNGQGLYMVRPGDTPDKVNDNPGVLSPDGKTIAFVKTLPYDEKHPENRSDALYVVPVAGKEPVQLYVARENGICSTGWWPDSKGLLFRIDPMHSASIMADGVGLYSLPLTGGEPQLLTTSLNHPEWLSWSPDGSKLLAVKGTGREIWLNKSLAVCDVKTGESIDLPQSPGTVSLDPDWSPDGKYITYVQAAEPKEDISSAAGVASWERTRALWVADADGKNARQIKEAGTGIKRPLWSRDGAHIVYLKDNSVWLVDLSGGSPVKIIGTFPDATDSFGYYGYVSWSNILALYRK